MRNVALILGCGNILFGDDGFGPKAAETLASRKDIPPQVLVMDAGTGAREILFDLVLDPERPGLLVIIDALDCGLEPGRVFRLDPDAIPENKRDDFSLHTLPASNLLKELRESCGMRIEIIACQVARIPEKVEMGLSAPVLGAVDTACELALETVNEFLGSAAPGKDR